ESTDDGCVDRRRCGLRPQRATRIVPLQPHRLQRVGLVRLRIAEPFEEDDRIAPLAGRRNRRARPRGPGALGPRPDALQPPALMREELVVSLDMLEPRALVDE